LETVIIFPIVLVLMVAIVQVSLWFFARNVCLGSAQEAARVASAQDAAAADAVAAGENFLAQAGHGLVSDSAVSVTWDPVSQTARAVVTATSLSLVGLFPTDIRQEAWMPLERPN
jgi:Flp pilus assembly protein TadG